MGKKREKWGKKQKKKPHLELGKNLPSLAVIPVVVLEAPEGGIWDF